MENIIDFFDNLSEDNINFDTLEKLSSLYTTDLNNSLDVVKLILGQMTNEGIEFSENLRLLNINEVMEFSHKNIDNIPLFQMFNNYICYDHKDQIFALYDIKKKSIIATNENLFEFLENELDSGSFIMPNGQYISLPFIYENQGKENYCIFGYDMLTNKDKYFFRVNNLIINSEKSYDCKIEIPIDIDKYTEEYKALYDAYENVDPEDFEELDNFLKSDLSNQALLEKYSTIVNIAKTEQENLQKATEIISSEFDEGYLTESSCLDIIHQYNTHSNIARLYEMTINYIKAHNI